MENRQLLEIMEKCGHFLYHRRGGKHGQMKVLRLLNERGCVTQSELLEVLALKSGTLSETVSKLETQGFIAKQRDLLDKRRINITITDEGKRFYEAQLEINRMQEEIMFTSLDVSEQEQLLKLLTTLFEDWRSKFDDNLFHCRKGVQ